MAAKSFIYAVIVLCAPVIVLALFHSDQRMR
jgi:hypothetical protein